MSELVLQTLAALGQTALKLGVNGWNSAGGASIGNRPEVAQWIESKDLMAKCS